MSTKYKNKPIHPTPAANGCSPTFGMTLREHYAGLALQGILANTKYEAPRSTKLSGMAIDALTAADLLIEELERTK